ADDLFEDIPHFRPLALDHALGGFDRARHAVQFELRVDEGLEQFERHLLRQPALVQLHLGSDDDHGPAGIVDALAQQVLTEAALLALEHVAQRLQRPLVGARDDAAPTAVVEQRVDRLLQHPLFVADDDVRRAQLDQSLQAVVPVDHPPIEIVQVRGCEPAAVQRDERTQLRRNYRNDFHNHPGRMCAGFEERLDQLQTLDRLLALRLGGRLAQFLPQTIPLRRDIQRAEHPLHRLGADLRRKGVLAELLLLLEIFLLGQGLAFLEVGQAGLDDDIALEIENLLQLAERHVEHEADAARHRLQEPDMRDRRCELDMAHALAADLRQRHLDAALLADDAAILHPLVLAAQALIVLDRTEDARAEQAVALGLERPVVDGFRLLDLAIRPGADTLRAGDRDADLVEALRARGLPEKPHQLVHRITPDALDRARLMAAAPNLRSPPGGAGKSGSASAVAAPPDRRTRSGDDKSMAFVCVTVRRRSPEDRR